MAKHMQPICPMRNDAKCMGAACAWSRHTVNDHGMWLFTCALVDNGETWPHGLAVIDRRGEYDDPVDRT